LQNRALTLKKCLFEIIITLIKVKINKSWIPFLNQSNIEEEWNKKIKILKDQKLKKKKNISSLIGKPVKLMN
jgi:hypothetical protein